MPELVKNLIIAGIVIVFVVILISLFVGIMMKMAFNHRGDGTPRLRYLQAEDFPGLVADPIKFEGNKKQVLRGYLYYYARFISFKELVIFAHGIGAGHTAYTTEIERLAREGFLVLAFDYTGCAMSGGTAMKSLIQPIVDIDYALRYIESRPDIKELKRYVVGHSWGAYAALCSLLIKKGRVDKVVSISGFVSSSKAVVANRPLLNIIYPFIYMYGYWRYGRYATYNGKKAVCKSKKPILLIHGEIDSVMKPKASIDVLAKAAKKRETVEIIRVEGRGHLPYLTKRAEEYLHKVQIDKGVIKSKAPVADYDVDYKLITEEDEIVMKSIVAFLKK